MFSFSAGYVSITDELVVSNANVYNGTDISITCNIATIGFPRDTTFNFKWTLNGVDIVPTTMGRFRIEDLTNGTFPELKKSVLYVEPILERHAGKRIN